MKLKKNSIVQMDSKQKKIENKRTRMKIEIQNKFSFYCFNFFGYFVRLIFLFNFFLQSKNKFYFEF